MERIIFKGENINEQNFAKEIRKRVRRYFKENQINTHGNAGMYFKTFVMLGLYLAPFIVLLTVDMGPWLAFGLAVLIGVGEAGIGMSVMHDAAHGAYSSKQWLNKFAASSMFLLGSNTINWKIQHNLNHHTFTNIYNHDPDISTKAVIRLCEHASLKKYHRYQQYYAFFFYGFMTLMRLFDEIFTLIKYNKQGITAELNVNPKWELIKLILTKLVYFGVIFTLPLIFTDFKFWQILIGFAAMQLTAGMIMSTVFQMAHVVEEAYQPLPDENNIIHTDWLVHQLKSTADFGKRNGLLSWYIGGLDFQVEHHLFPNICHVHYAAIAPIVEETAREFGLTYNTNRTFFHALVSHYKRLKELGRERPPMVS